MFCLLFKKMAYLFIQTTLCAVADVRLSRTDIEHSAFSLYACLTLKYIHVRSSGILRAFSRLESRVAIGALQIANRDKFTFSHSRDPMGQPLARARAGTKGERWWIGCNSHPLGAARGVDSWRVRRPYATYVRNTRDICPCTRDFVGACLLNDSPGFLRPRRWLTLAHVPRSYTLTSRRRTEIKLRITSLECTDAGRRGDGGDFEGTATSGRLYDSRARCFLRRWARAWPRVKESEKRGRKKLRNDSLTRDTTFKLTPVFLIHRGTFAHPVFPPRRKTVVAFVC